MDFCNIKQVGIPRFLVSAILLCTFISCDSLFKGKEDKIPVARVGETYLYKEDLKALLLSNMSKADSTSLVNNYINNWAYKQLLLSKAKINLPEDKLEHYEQLVSNYRTDLYTGAYKEALVLKSHDTAISKAQLTEFYEREKENFKLKERIMQLRFVELPIQYLDKDLVAKKLKNFKEEDKRYLDSISVQFRKVNFNDSIWVSVFRVMEEITPLTPENQDKYLKKSQFFELQDSLGVYLAEVNDLLEINDVAPLPYIEPTIKQLLLNRRKLDYMKKLEVELMDEAIKEKEFEVYEQGN
ncbi:peptidyl-prolyl cis-trans isomerase [Arenibacter sp. F26102]|uniref:peptidyl-prolyl cis-trans isomerase n=1 Tax=Arenibacter sp. F26102 TaxID=2926416 RepID=UPI001FF476F7|nr:peptidyl-prolyl cis-trans isomerase [Arenibacter sp. F26102]MCK0147901.1 peptidyl-prolyl cis-trans isomerase [Arenibacter sp. F26102]